MLLAERPEVASSCARRYDAVFVDEYQDTDPAQVRLLRALAGDGRDLVAFGDPDQSIYAFRGADVNGILDFPDAFPPRATAAPPPVAVLRGLPPLRRRAAGRHPRCSPAGCRWPGCPPTACAPHRELAAGRRRAAGSRSYTYPTAGAELDNIADLLRRAHLEDGVPWGEMAVLVRAGGRSHPRRCAGP